MSAHNINVNSMTDTNICNSETDMLSKKPTAQLYIDVISQIIKQMPDSDNLKILVGTTNAQASFYFKDPTNDKINASLYNNLLSARIKGMGEGPAGVGQVEQMSSVFTNSYLQIYKALRYQLSQADKATEQQLVAETAASIKALTPDWNAWVESTGSSVKKLDTKDTRTALVQMTATMTGPWLNPDYKSDLQMDPSYPYQHMNDFDKIFNNIPLSVSGQMRNEIKAVYNAQGAAGGIIAKVSGATQTLNGIINNIENPDLNNGGLVLTNDNNIPGLVFEPESALSIVKILAANPPVHVYSHKLSLTKSGVNQLAVISTGMNEKKVMTHDFFCVLDDCNTVSCIFDEDYCGDKFTMEVIVNNATVSPRMEVKPLLYDNNSDGWMYAIPVLDALKNGSSNDVTGYVFDGGAPDFDFFKDGDFGYIESLVYSQFLEFELTF